MTTSLNNAARIAVIGGGYAGLAAAVEVARSGDAVHVFEASRELGGRARRVARGPLMLDNGQHLLVGAYTELLTLMGAVGITEADVLARRPLSLRIEPEFRLRKRGNGKLGLLWALLTARGLAWRDRTAAFEFMRELARDKYIVNPERSLSKFLRNRYQTRRLREMLWHKLCLAALNTPANRASAQVFVNVLRDSFAGKGGASDLLFPIVDLTALFPEPAARFIESKGGTVSFGAAVRSVTSTGTNSWRINDDPEQYNAIIIAADPTNAARLLRSEPRVEAADANAITAIEALGYEPIYTIYLQYPADVKLVEPMVGMSTGHAQWLFDRGQLGGPPGLIAAVISAGGSHETLDRADLERSVADELAGRFGFPVAPEWMQTIAERRATFECLPGLSRPPNALQSPGLFLAGDYTAGDYPSTLESAVRSGRAAARLALATTNAISSTML